MKITDFLQDLAKVAGKQDDESILTLLKNESLAEVEIDDSVKSKIIGSLYTKEAAKNDQEIQDHYYEKIQPKIYSIVDEITEKYADKYGVDKSEFREDASSTEKLKALLNKLATAKKESSPSKDNEVIKDLNDEIVSLKNQIEEKENQHKKEFKDFKLNTRIKDKIKSLNLIDSVNDLPGGKERFADTTIAEWKDRYHLDLDESNNIILADKSDPTREVYIENQKIGFEELIDRDLDKWKKRSDSTPPKHDAKEKKVFSEDDKPKTLQDQIRKRGRTTSISM